MSSRERRVPVPYAQGIYARPGGHGALIRFSSASNHLGPDALLGNVLGCALKMFEVEGVKLVEDEPDSNTFDYVLKNNPIFIANTAKHYQFIQEIGNDSAKYLARDKAGFRELLTGFLTERTDEELPALADRLVQSKVAAIMAIGTPASRAAMHASTSIPVVFVSGDPIAAGLAASLARPGANGTGVYVPAPELNAKRLELLTQIAPRAHRIAYLRNPSTVLAAEILKAVQNATRALNPDRQ